MHLVAPLRHPDPPVARPLTQVTMSPATVVEAVLTPPVALVVEVTSSTEVQPQATADLGMPGPDAASPDPPMWAEQMEAEEAELRAMSISSENDDVFVRGPVPTMPDPSPLARPTLQARDVVLAACSHHAQPILNPPLSRRAL